MKNIRNCKIRVLNVEHSKAIQLALFESGYEWRDSGTAICHTYAPYLLIDSDGSVIYVCDTSFEVSDKQEIFFYNGEFHHEPELSEINKVDDVIDIRRCKIDVSNIRGCALKDVINELLRVGCHAISNVDESTETIVINDDYKVYGEMFAASLPLVSKYKELFFYDGKFHHKPEPQETNADIKTHPIFDNGFQYGEVVYFVGIDGGHKATYLAPDIENELVSIVVFDNSGMISRVSNSELVKQSDYEDRKNLENLSAKIANLFAASVETVYPSSKLMNPDNAIFLEFTKRLKSEDLLPF